MITTTATANPFPGLLAYLPQQSDLFFGRDEQIEYVIKKMRLQRFVGLVGTSGSGKSSLVLAGVIPHLKGGFMLGRGAKWRVVTLRPGNDPMEELWRKLALEFGCAARDAQDSMERSSRGLVQFAELHLNRDENLLVFVDQFEELIRYRALAKSADQRASATSFLKLLLVAAGRSQFVTLEESSRSVYVVITMRSEYLGKCAQFPGLAEALTDGQFVVPRMDRFQMRQAIEGPCAMAGGQITEELVQQLLNDASDRPDQLPLLQHALKRMWNLSAEYPDHLIADKESQRTGQTVAAENRAAGLKLQLMEQERAVHVISVKQYQQIGGSIEEALNRAADEICDQLIKKDQRHESIIQAVFQRLAEPGAEDEEVRRPTPLSELAAIAGVREEKIRIVTAPFIAEGFLVESNDKDPIIDVTHESLIRRWKRLNDWVKEEARSARVYRRLVATVAQKGSWYRGQDLAIALDQSRRWNAAWASRYPEESEGQERVGFGRAVRFLKRSQRRARVNKALVTGATCLILVLALLVAVFYRMSISVRSSAYTRLLAAKSSQLLSTGPTRLSQRALMLGLESLRRDFVADSDQAVRDNTAVIPILLQRMKHDDCVTDLKFLGDGSLLASSSKDNTARIWDVATGHELRRYEHKQPVLMLQADPESGYVATASGPVRDPCSIASVGTESVQVFRLQGDVNPIFQQETGDHIRALALKGGRLSFGFTNGVRTVMLNKTEKITQRAIPTKSQFILTRDGKFLISANTQGTEITDLQTGRSRSLHFTPEMNTRRLRLKLSADEKTLAVGTESQIVFRRIQTGQEPAKTFHPTLDMDFFSLSSDGKLLALAGFDEGLEVWNLGPHKKIGEATYGEIASTHFWYIVSFSNDSKYLAAGTPDGAVVIYSIDPWKEILRVGLDRIATRLAWNDDDTRVAIGTEDGLITVWQIPNKAEAWSSSERFSYSPKGLYIVKTKREFPMQDITTVLDREWNEVVSFKAEDVVFSGDDHYVAYTAETGQTIFIYDLKERRLQASLPAESSVVGMEFSQNGSSIWTVTTDGWLRQRNLAGAQSIVSINFGQFSEGRHIANQVRFSPNGRICATGLSMYGEYKLWDLGNGGKSLGSIAAVPFWGLQFSENQKLVAGYTKDGNLTVWSLANGRELWHDSLGQLSSKFKFNESGTILVGGNQHLLRAWSSINGKPVLDVDNESAEITHFALNRAGEYLATSWTDSKLRIWRLSDGVQVNSIPITSSGDVFFSPDDRYVIAEDRSPDNMRQQLYRAFWWQQQDILREGCRHAVFNLSAEEWKREIPDSKPQRTCPNLP